MSSQADMSGQTQARSVSLLNSFLLGLTATSQTQFLIFDPVSESLTMYHLAGRDLDLEALFNEKSGPLPASKAAIEAMPRVAMTEEEEKAECAVCLEGYQVGGEVREMPCKHRFHSGCIEKWLGIHGSCPVCRFLVPVEEENNKKGSGEEEGARGERQSRGEIAVFVTLWIGGGGGEPMDVDLDSISGRESGDSGSDGSRGSGAVDDSSSQDMEF